MKLQTSFLSLVTYLKQGATFSPDRIYRYELYRIWSPGGKRINFVCLNCSTADEFTDDNTIRRCVSFAKEWGYDESWHYNIFAFRATDPKKLLTTADPVGPDNDRILASLRQPIVVAWGNWGRLHSRSELVKNLLPPQCLCFGLTSKWEPIHPLYLPRTTTPRLFQPNKKTERVLTSTA